MAFPKRYFPLAYFPGRYFPPATEVSVAAVSAGHSAPMGSAGGPWKLRGDPFKKRLKECYDELDTVHRKALEKASGQVAIARSEGRLRRVSDLRDLGGSSDPADLYIPIRDDLQLEEQDGLWKASETSILVTKAAQEAIEDVFTAAEVTRRSVARIIQNATESAKNAVEAQRLLEEDDEEFIELMLLGAL